MRSWPIESALVEVTVGNCSKRLWVNSVSTSGTWLSAPIAPVTQVLTLPIASSSPQRTPVTPDAGTA